MTFSYQGDDMYHTWGVVLFWVAHNQQLVPPQSPMYTSCCNKSLTFSSQNVTTGSAIPKNPVCEFYSRFISSLNPLSSRTGFNELCIFLMSGYQPTPSLVINTVCYLSFSSIFYLRISCLPFLIKLISARTLVGTIVNILAHRYIYISSDDQIQIIMMIEIQEQITAYINWVER